MLTPISHIAKSVTPQNGSRMHDHVAADFDACVKRYARIKAATPAKLRSSAEKTKSADLRLFPNFNFFFDYGKRADCSAASQAGRAGYDRGGMHSVSDGRCGNEPGGGAGESELRLRRHEQCLAGNHQLRCGDHATRCRLSHARRM